MSSSLRNGNVTLSHLRDYVHHASLLDEAKGCIRVCQNSKREDGSKWWIHSITTKIWGHSLCLWRWDNDQWQQLWQWTGFQLHESKLTTTSSIRGPCNNQSNQGFGLTSTYKDWFASVRAKRHQNPWFITSFPVRGFLQCDWDTFSSYPWGTSQWDWGPFNDQQNLSHAWIDLNRKWSEPRLFLRSTRKTRAQDFPFQFRSWLSAQISIGPCSEQSFRLGRYWYQCPGNEPP